MSNGWYYAVGGVQNGPIGIDELKAQRAAGQIPSDSLIWKEGMENWKPWNEIPELAAGLGQAAPVAPVAGGNPYASQEVNPIGAPSAIPLGARPPTYLWQSIVCTVLCCLPFGVVGIVYAAKVDGLANTGRMAEAIQASDKAKFWSWMSFGFGLGFTILAFAGGFLGAIG